jgi:hypothetical protein
MGMIYEVPGSTGEVARQDFRREAPPGRRRGTTRSRAAE